MDVIGTGSIDTKLISLEMDFIWSIICFQMVGQSGKVA